VGRVADGAEVERATAWYALLLATDVTVLNGTTDPNHMREDLEGLERINAWRETDRGRVMWEECWGKFVEMIGK